MTDIAIIGSGCAGISAAITAKARNKSVLLFGEETIGGKLNGEHVINNFPGFYGKTGNEIQKAFSDHLKSMDISVTAKKITGIYNMGKHFSLVSGQDFYEAKSVIIASGVSFGKPLKGELEFLGRGVSYCATCDGMLYKGKDVAVLCYDKNEEKEAAFLAEVCNKVYFYPLYKEEKAIDNRCEILDGADFDILGDKKVSALIVRSECGKYMKDVDAVFVLRRNIPPAQLIAGIEMRGNHIKVDSSMATSINGIFACGDIAGTPYQYVKACGEGNVASLSAVSYLASK